VGAHIGALVVKYLILERENVSVAVDGGANVMQLLARMVGGDEVFASVLDPLDGPPHAKGGGADQHVLGINLAANAEAAADVALIELN
jgi:hypothetical protein